MKFPRVNLKEVRCDSGQG